MSEAIVLREYCHACGGVRDSTLVRMMDATWVHCKVCGKHVDTIWVDDSTADGWDDE